MLRQKALEILRNVSTYGKPLENHCLRLAEFTMALGKLKGVQLDEDLIFAASYLHDIGLCVKNPHENNYLKRGLNYVRCEVAKWGLDETQTKVFEDAMLYNHSLGKVPGISAGGELVRLAVAIEHSLGRVLNGLDPKTCKEIFKKYPRRGFNQVLLSFFKTAVIEDGPKDLFAVFFPKKGPHLYEYS